MMTLDEAIEHCKEVALSLCNECGEDHRQLALWLTELKSLREKEGRKETSSRADLIRNLSNEDLESFLCDHFNCDDCPGRVPDPLQEDCKLKEWLEREV